jgi:hypothetical protein
VQMVLALMSRTLQTLTRLPPTNCSLMSAPSAVQSDPQEIGGRR